jgi:hypothetical protein
MHRIIVALATIAAAAVALTLALAPAASAKDGDVRVAGTCTGASTSKLKLSPENGRTEVEFEVDQNRNGVAWRVVITRNCVVVATSTAVTRAPSGSFEVRRVIAAGGVVRATATRSGETCTAQAGL